MKFDKTATYGWLEALRGMRNPLESWNKSDTTVKIYEKQAYEILKYKTSTKTYALNDIEGNKCLSSNIMVLHIGDNDLKLVQKLIKSGTEHRKFLRQILVTVEITAPLYWWKEFDTYKVGVTANSTSTMHTLATKPITVDCFERHEDSFRFLQFKNGCDSNYYFRNIVDYMEFLRQQYLETKNNDYWLELVRVMPCSWLQTRTVSMNYENVLNMYKQRKHHKLDEWKIKFCGWVMKLPYARELFEDPWK